MNALFIFPKYECRVAGPRTIDVTYVSKNGTGTGELVIVIHTVDGIPVGKVTTSVHHV